MQRDWCKNDLLTPTYCQGTIPHIFLWLGPLCAIDSSLIRWKLVSTSKYSKRDMSKCLYSVGKSVGGGDLWRLAEAGPGGSRSCHHFIRNLGRPKVPSVVLGNLAIIGQWLRKHDRVLIFIMSHLSTLNVSDYHLWCLFLAFQTNQWLTIITLVTLTLTYNFGGKTRPHQLLSLMNLTWWWVQTKIFS